MYCNRGTVEHKSWGTVEHVPVCPGSVFHSAPVKLLTVIVDGRLQLHGLRRLFSVEKAYVDSISLNINTFSYTLFFAVSGVWQWFETRSERLPALLQH